MKQRASTKLTFFWKFIFPGLFGIPFGAAAVTLLVQQSWMALPFGVVALFFGSAYVWFCPRYMAVTFDDQFLYVSKASKEIRIPWSQVVRIHRLLMSRWPTYAISFDTPTEFGGKIFFSIPFRPPFGYHTDVVQRMQERISKAALCFHIQARGPGASESER